MRSFTAVFLIFLAIKVGSAAPSTSYPAGTCSAGPGQTDPGCQININNCIKPASPYIENGPPSCPCLCEPVPTDASMEEPSEECCDKKTVGDYSYTKVSEGIVPPECPKNCIYSRDDKSGSKYCFAIGDQEVHCLDTEPSGAVGSFGDVTVFNDAGEGAGVTVEYKNCNSTGDLFVAFKDHLNIFRGSCLITKIGATTSGDTCIPYVSSGTDLSKFEISSNETAGCFVVPVGNSHNVTVHNEMAAGASFWLEYNNCNATRQIFVSPEGQTTISIGSCVITKVGAVTSGQTCEPFSVNHGTDSSNFKIGLDRETDNCYVTSA